VKDLGVANFILRMKINKNRVLIKLWLNHRKYIETILKHFNMQDCKPIKVPIHAGEKLIVEQLPKMHE
jgi:hypothetical protein